MNGDLLDALGAVGWAVYDEALRRYPDLLLNWDAESSGDEGLAVRRVLITLDDLFLELERLREQLEFTRMAAESAERGASEDGGDLPF